MKKIAAIPLAGMVALSAAQAAPKFTSAKDYYNTGRAFNITNKFGLVYDGAISENKNGAVNIRSVEYEVGGIKVAANLYMPAGYDEKAGKKYAAVTVAHPNGGVKEQVAGLYAQKLAELGYIAIAADARFQGASGGLPRDTDHPANRIEDISGMVDYLLRLKTVDADRIGSLGICGGGGYTLAAAQTDKRIKAVAALSMFNSGRVRRLGFQDAAKDTAQERLRNAGAARAKELSGDVEYIGFLPPDKSEDELRAFMESLPEGLYKDGIDYYGLSYKHPRSTGSYTASSNTFFAFRTPTLAYGAASNHSVSSVQSFALCAPLNEAAI